MPGPTDRLERERVDVERDRSATCVAHRQVEERRAGLLGVDAHRAGRCSPIAIGRPSIGNSPKNSCGATTRFERSPPSAAGGQLVGRPAAPARPRARSASTRCSAISRMKTLPCSLTNTRRDTGGTVPVGRLASTAVIPTRLSIITPVFDPPLGAFLACADSVSSPRRSRLGVVRRRRLLDAAGGARRAGRTRGPRPADPGASRRVDERRHRRRVERRAGDGRPASSSRCSTTTTRLVPTALAEWSPRSTTRLAADVDYLYTDEAHVLADGRESAHFLKPDWSPERFRSSMYTCHLSVLRAIARRRASAGSAIGLRRLAGPRPDPARHRDDRRRGRRIAPPAVPRATTGATSRARCRGRRQRLSAAIVNGRRAVQEQCDRLGHRRRRSCTARSPAATASCAGCRPARTVTVVVRDARSKRCELAAVPAGRSAATLLARRSRRRIRPTSASWSPTRSRCRAELVDLLDDAAGDRWHAGPGRRASGRSPPRSTGRCTMYPADVLVVVAPGLVPRGRSRRPTGWARWSGLATSTGAGRRRAR